jgi:hypothetical protein
MVPSHVSFGTIQAYYAIPGDTSLKDPLVFSPGFRFPYACDAISFNMGYDKMWYTAKDKNGKYDNIYMLQSTPRDGTGKESGQLNPGPSISAPETIIINIPPSPPMEI